jgi:hypothetical protein
MKRAYTEHESIPPDDLLKDIPQSQLAAIGAVALGYNYAENTINRMLLSCTGIPIALYRDVMSRINGIDGRIELVKKGAKEHLGLSEETLVFLADTLGDDGFKLLKKYRDAVIHARFVNRVTGVGELIESRGKHSEVLLTEEALLALYTRLEYLRVELSSLSALMREQDAFNSLGDSDDREKQKRKRQIERLFGIAKECRVGRLRLPPLPEFPDAITMNAIPVDGEPITGIMAARETLDGAPADGAGQ